MVKINTASSRFRQRPSYCPECRLHPHQQQKHEFKEVTFIDTATLQLFTTLLLKGALSNSYYHYHIIIINSHFVLAPSMQFCSKGTACVRALLLLSDYFCSHVKPLILHE